MKKSRSNLPRRKRSNYSPILKSPTALKLDSSSMLDSSSNLTREVTFTCDSTSRVSSNTRSQKKRSFADGNGAIVDEFRRITRSYSKRMEIMAKKEVPVELSEASSCVVLLNSSSKSIIRKRPAVIRDAKVENSICEIEKSEVTTRSECSVFPKELIDGRDNLQGDEETDVVSVSVNFGTNSDFKLSDSKLTERQLTCSKAEDYAGSIASRLESHRAPKSGEITSLIDNSVTNETVNDDNAENCGESKLILAEFDLACSEHISDRYEECDYSLAEYTDDNMESSEFEFSSDWYDSGSQFSERSVGDTVPSPTFQLFLFYRQKFCKSEFSTNVSSVHSDYKPSNRIFKLLRPEDEEHEQSYQMMKERERRQVYLRDYANEYSEMKESADMVVQQRLKMVNYIMKQSANKELQKETMFLGVSLLDRFLSKGYFKNKSELEIAGIACLTLATRIEENQPYNSIRQKSFTVAGIKYSRSEVVAMEWLVQEVLNFQCYLPTIYNFLWFYLKAARANQGVTRTAKYLAESALLGHKQLCYWPSTVAASLVCLACLAENKQSSHQQITQIDNGSNDKDLPYCMKSMEYLVQHIR